MLIVEMNMILCVYTYVFDIIFIISYRIVQNFQETIFADAINVTPNVHNYTKIFACKIFVVEGRSLKNEKTLRYTEVLNNAPSSVQ